MSDQSGRVQVLSGQAVVEEAWAEVVEPAGPVDEVDRAQSRALLSQMHAHRNACRQRLSLVCRLPATTSWPPTASGAARTRPAIVASRSVHDRRFSCSRSHPGVGTWPSPRPSE